MKYENIGEIDFMSSSTEIKGVDSSKYIRVKSQANARGIPFLLTLEEYTNIISNKCHYCGTRIKIGVDRLNSFGPYDKKNCVPCCVPDNLIKGQKYDRQETMVMVKALNEFRFNRDKEITETGCIKIPIRVFEDDRGFFTETYSNKILSSIGLPSAPDQMNCSVSKYDVLRGMHYNNVNPQSKLVRVIKGEIIDCVIDLRENSPTYGILECFYLSTKNSALYIPKGFAHGFWSLEEDTQVLYSCWGNFDPNNDRGINPMDDTFSFPWLRYGKDYIISEKDKNWQKFDKTQHFVPENLSEFMI